VQYVLIIVFALFGGHGAMTSQAIVFPDKETCEAAKTGFEKRFTSTIPDVNGYASRIRAAGECQPLSGKDQ
jgi:hypothetical protein